ncbi:unnamed protein product [Closterium sp. Naga37s-1]|nr:unnamed protein product [Closterium sp. Naga37s-1]
MTCNNIGRFNMDEGEEDEMLTTQIVIGGQLVGDRPDSLDESPLLRELPPFQWGALSRKAACCRIPRALPCPPSRPAEDAMLLRHALRYGTRQWGALEKSSLLPHRDNKSCCNRFLFLKK